MIKPSRKPNLEISDINIKRILELTQTALKVKLTELVFEDFYVNGQYAIFFLDYGEYPLIGDYAWKVSVKSENKEKERKSSREPIRDDDFENPLFDDYYIVNGELVYQGTSS